MLGTGRYIDQLRILHNVKSIMLMIPEIAGPVFQHFTKLLLPHLPEA